MVLQLEEPLGKVQQAKQASTEYNIVLSSRCCRFAEPRTL
jgi:hypothetical protein